MDWVCMEPFISKIFAGKVLSVDAGCIHDCVCCVCADCLLTRPVPGSRDAATSAVKRSIGSTTGCTITEKAPTRAFFWLKAATTAFTFKTLLRHYAKRALTPRSLNVKLGSRRNYQGTGSGYKTLC